MTSEQGTVGVSASALERPQEPLKAVSFILVAITVFSLQDAAIKWLSTAYPVHEIVFVRSLVAMAIIVPFARLSGGLRSLKTRQPRIHVARGLCAFSAYTCYYLALASLPLAEAVALFFSSPLFITALSLPVLGERVGWRRWGAVLLGFAGILIMLRPGADMFDPAGVLAVASAAFYALQAMVTRRYCAGDTGVSMAFSGVLVYLPLSLAIGLVIGNGGLAEAAHSSVSFLLRAWTLPSAHDLGIMAFSGLTFAVGFYGVSQAYRLTSATNVAPLEYVALPLGALWGYTIWHDVPDAYAAFGAALVVASGLYVFHRGALHGGRLISRRGVRRRVRL